MSPQEIGQLVSSVGFPIVVALYVLIRLEARMKEIGAAIRDLALAVTNLNASLKT